MKYQSLFIPKPVLRPEYSTLFEHHGFLIQGLLRMYPFLALELTKERDILLDPLSLPDFDIWRRYKLIDYTVKSTQRHNTRSYTFRGM